MSASKKQASSQQKLTAPHPSAAKPAAPMNGTHFVGIDIGKESCVVFVLPTRQSRTFDNTPPGYVELIAWLKANAVGGVGKIVLEATGGYERELLLALLDTSLPAVSINPRQSHHARHTLLKLDKTDHSDAEVLAWMAEHMNLEVSPRPSENQLFLRDLVARRGQLVTMRTMEKNRLQQARRPKEQYSIKRHVEFLEREIKKMEAEIAKLVEGDDDWTRTAQILQSMPGVGPATAHTLIAELPELGDASREEISSLAGLAPRAVQSGDYDGPRHIRGGRGLVRTALYMATLSALKHNPVIKQSYIRLRKLGKLAKVAIVACMRKLLVVLNGLLKTGVEWRNMLETTLEPALLPGTPEKG